MIAASGFFTAARVEGLLAVAVGERLEAGVAQDHLQRPEDLRLVVADEHAGAGALTAGVALPARPSRSSGQLDRRSVVPWPGSDSRDRAPPLASTKPAGDRQPEAGARCRCRRRSPR